jgi:hypothetical protein
MHWVLSHHMILVAAAISVVLTLASVTSDCARRSAAGAVE